MVGVLYPLILLTLMLDSNEGNSEWENILCIPQFSYI